MNSRCAFTVAGIRITCALLVFFLVLLSARRTESADDSYGRKLYSVNNCGPNCLWLACQIFSLRGIIEQDVYSLFVDDKKQTNFLQLAEAAKKLGMDARGVKTSLGNLVAENTLAIVRLKADHFVLFVGVDGNELVFGDAPTGILRMDKSAFLSQWDSMALMLRPILDTAATPESSISPSLEEPAVSGLRFETFTVNFGKTREGEVPYQVLSFLNTSDETIRISKITKSCGCAKVDVLKETKSYNPGERGELKFSYDTHGLAGHLKQQIWIHTDELRKPIEIALNIQVIRDVILTPRRVSFGDIEKRELPSTRKVHVQFTGDEDFQIADLSSDSPYISAIDFSQDSALAGRLTVNVTASADTPTGQSNATISLGLASSEGRLNVDVPVSVNVLSPIRFLSDGLFVGIMSPGATVEKNVRFVGVEDWMATEFALGTSDADWLRAEKTMTDGVQNVTIVVTAPSDFGEFRGELWVTTPSGERVTCSVYGTVRIPSAEAQ